MHHLCYPIKALKILLHFGKNGSYQKQCRFCLKTHNILLNSIATHYANLVDLTAPALMRICKTSSTFGCAFPFSNSARARYFITLFRKKSFASSDVSSPANITMNIKNLLQNNSTLHIDHVQSIQAMKNCGPLTGNCTVINKTC